MIKKYGEFLIIDETEPTRCLKDINEAIKELADLRNYLGGAIDGTTEIIIKKVMHNFGTEEEYQIKELVTVAMKWDMEVQEDDGILGADTGERNE